MSTSRHLNQIYDEYNNAGSVPDDFDDEKLKEALNELKATDQIEKSKFARKIAATKKIFSAAAAEVSSGLAGKLHVDLSTKVSFSANINAPKEMTSTQVSSNGNGVDKVNMNININVLKVLNMPPEELFVYAQTIISAPLEKAAEKNKAALASENKNDKQVTLVENSVGAEKEQKRDGDNPLRPGLIEYIKDFVKKALGFEPTDLVCESMADSLLSTGAAENMFDKDVLSSVASPSLDMMYEARNSKLLSNAKNAAAEGLTHESMSYTKQATELLSVRTSESFNKMKQQGTVTKEFCESYIHDFLSSRGVDPSSIVFTTNPDQYQGAFYDNETPQRINVDLSKVNSVTELAMTLSHELTHGVDSKRNKSQGIQNRYGGGLVGSINWESLANSGLTDKDSEAYKLLAFLDKACYHLDTNERHGRIGELSALEFMRKVAGDDPATKREITTKR